MIYSEWDPKPANQGDIERVLGRMRRRLELDPFYSREQWAKAAADADAARVREQLSQKDLDQFLTRAAEFDPGVFKDDLQKLRALLPEE